MNFTIGQIVNDAENRASPADSVNDFVPSHLIGTIVNLIQIMHNDLTMNLPENVTIPSSHSARSRGEDNDYNMEFYQKMIERVLYYLDRTLNTVLQVQITGEAPFSYEQDGFFAYTRRQWSHRITGHLNASSIGLYVPDSVFGDVEAQELFQFINLMPFNPLAWGHEIDDPITSACARMEFTYPNSTQLNINNLSEESEIVINVPNFEQTTDERTFNEFSPEETMVTILDINDLLETSLVHVRVCAAPMADLNLTSLSLTVFLGRGYEPYTHQFDQQLEIDIYCLESRSNDQIIVIEDP